MNKREEKKYMKEHPTLSAVLTVLAKFIAIVWGAFAIFVTLLMLLLVATVAKVLVDWMVFVWVG